jgi:hypothetical protein
MIRTLMHAPVTQRSVTVTKLPLKDEDTSFKKLGHFELVRSKGVRNRGVPLYMQIWHARFMYNFIIIMIIQIYKSAGKYNNNYYG